MCRRLQIREEHLLGMNLQNLVLNILEICIGLQNTPSCIYQFVMTDGILCNKIVVFLFKKKRMMTLSMNLIYHHHHHPPWKYVYIELFDGKVMMQAFCYSHLKMHVKFYITSIEKNWSPIEEMSIHNSIILNEKRFLETLVHFIFFC